MRERLEKLPIYVAPKREYIGKVGQEPERPYHITQKEAMKKYPEVTTRTLSTIKKHPGIVGKLEKLHDVSNKKVYFIGSPDPFGRHFGRTEVEGYVDNPNRTVYVMEPPRTYDDQTKSEFVSTAVASIMQKYPEKQWKQHFERLKTETDRLIFKDDTKTDINKKIRHSYASTALHELQHVEQSRDPKEFENIAVAESSLSWLERKQEIEAREYETKKLKERQQKGKILPGMFKKILKLD